LRGALSISRKIRKLDHIKYALEISNENKLPPVFKDIYLINDAIPELNIDEIDSSCSFIGKQLRAPLMINAITGGHARVSRINRELARAAAAAGIAMAVGSQRAALDDYSVRETFEIAREENPDGILLANLNAQCSLDEAREAVDMIAADGIQLHLNVSQELFMREGDTDFRGVLNNVEHIVKSIGMPVLIKEVGFGMSKEVVKRLYEVGVRFVDISGMGGTNFALIENRRGGRGGECFEQWGIPTAVSLLEALNTGRQLTVVASGGLRTSMDIALALAAGAKMTAMAGPFLTVLMNKGLDGLIRFINELIAGLRRVMMTAGAGTLAALPQKPLVITGLTAEWLLRRGIDVNAYARRSNFCWDSRNNL